MKAHVYVTLKTSVLDPQGQTIQNALRKIGFAEVTAVRQGKYFELTLAEGLTADAARAHVERIAREVLTNPVIEEYTYRARRGNRSAAGQVLRAYPRRGAHGRRCPRTCGAHRSRGAHQSSDRRVHLPSRGIGDI